LRGFAILAALLVLALGAPVAAAQSGSPFDPLPPPQPTPAPAPAPSSPSTPSNSSSSEKVSPLGVLGLFVAGIMVVVAIGFFIMRDARRSLPRSKRRKKGAPAPPAPRPAGSKRPPPRRPGASARKRRSRQKRRAR
jgi:hypothetical protein